MRLPALAKLAPRSLQAQLLLAIAAALLLGQALSAVLIYRAQEALRNVAVIHAAAYRLVLVADPKDDPRDDQRDARRDKSSVTRNPRVERTGEMAQLPGDVRDRDAETELKQVLADQDLAVSQLMVVRRAMINDPYWHARPRRQIVFRNAYRAPSRMLLVAAIRPQGSAEWMVARVPIPAGERMPLLPLIVQTLFIYLLLVGAVALLMRRITRPLAALTGRIKRFAGAPAADAPLLAEGPEDLRRLIEAHNAMEARIAALIDEKDVMLGAIGHDLKTPLAALRVRIESVEDGHERARMAATIEDIVRTLDDILALARIGRSNEPREMTELSALIGGIVEEYEDMGESVVLTEASRIVAPLQATWLRRALRNLIGNALRYGGAARVSLVRLGQSAVVRIDDDGPGIAPEEIGRMLEPFIRGDPSRNSETGGAGLGLTLARAIAEQHGGVLSLANRLGADGGIAGLTATLQLPLPEPG